MSEVVLKTKEKSLDSAETPLRDYAALGDGRSVALVSRHGSIDWWCVPNMNSPPLFDRLWDKKGSYFALVPEGEHSVERVYARDSNVLETVITTATGKARISESLNSGSAGRLPWCELARRAECLEGVVRFKIKLRLRADAQPYLSKTANGTVFHAGPVLGMIVHSGGVDVKNYSGEGLDACFEVRAGQRETVALVAGENEPLVAPQINDIDRRIDLTDQEWRDWSDHVVFQGPWRGELLRNALALKLLLFSPTGAIAAAPTSSLPEKIGGHRNYDYRFGWVRDAAYVIKAFLSLNQQAEAKAAFTWIMRSIARNGAKVLYTLYSEAAPEVEFLDRPGYGGSRPVRRGNDAAHQRQLGIYGDVFEVAADFVRAGNIIDPSSAKILSKLADDAAQNWHLKDSGIWELETEKNFTSSKISCWQALDRALKLAAGNHINGDGTEEWQKQRDAIIAWIDEHCWSSEKQAYMAWDGSNELDISVALGVRFGFPRRERLASTLKAIDRELGAGPFHYRCTWSPPVEGCFLACTLWLVLAKHELGLHKEATRVFEGFKKGIGPNSGILPEMIDPNDGQFLGNMPLGLTHLAMVQVISVLATSYSHQAA